MKRVVDSGFLPANCGVSPRWTDVKVKFATQRELEPQRHQTVGDNWHPQFVSAARSPAQVSISHFGHPLPRATRIRNNALAKNHVIPLHSLWDKLDSRISRLPPYSFPVGFDNHSRPVPPATEEFSRANLRQPQLVSQPRESSVTQSAMVRADLSTQGAPRKADGYHKSSDRSDMKRVARPNKSLVTFWAGSTKEIEEQPHILVRPPRPLQCGEFSEFYSLNHQHITAWVQPKPGSAIALKNGTKLPGMPGWKT
jgi:hypothetical protein